MMMGVAGLAAEVCNDLYAQELAPGAQARIFNSISGTSMTTAMVDDVFNRAARACWGRAPTDIEKSLVRDQIQGNSINNISGLATTSIRLKSIAVCMSVLSSLDGIRH
jgi:hypothetical protein